MWVRVRVLLTCCSRAHSPYIHSRNMQTPCRKRVDLHLQMYTVSATDETCHWWCYVLWLGKRGCLSPPGDVGITQFPNCTVPNFTTRKLKCWLWQKLCMCVCVTRLPVDAPVSKCNNSVLWSLYVSIATLFTDVSLDTNWIPGTGWQGRTQGQGGGDGVSEHPLSWGLVCFFFTPRNNARLLLC